MCYNKSRKPGACCRIEGCGASLSDCSKYYIEKRICPRHVREPELRVNGESMRFCQQCGRLQLLSQFDGKKRSCRVALARRLEAQAGHRCNQPPPIAVFISNSSSSCTTAVPAALASTASFGAAGVAQLLPLPWQQQAGLYGGAAAPPAATLLGQMPQQWQLALQQQQLQWQLFKQQQQQLAAMAATAEEEVAESSSASDMAAMLAGTPTAIAAGAAATAALPTADGIGPASSSHAAAAADAPPLADWAGPDTELHAFAAVQAAPAPASEAIILEPPPLANGAPSGAAMWDQVPLCSWSEAGVEALLDDMLLADNDDAASQLQPAGQPGNNEEQKTAEVACAAACSPHGEPCDGSAGGPAPAPAAAPAAQHLATTDRDAMRASLVAMKHNLQMMQSTIAQWEAQLGG